MLRLAQHGALGLVLRLAQHSATLAQHGALGLVLRLVLRLPALLPSWERASLLPSERGGAAGTQLACGGVRLPGRRRLGRKLRG